MPGKLARIGASGRAKKRPAISPSRALMRSLRARISPASSAQMRLSDLLGGQLDVLGPGGGESLFGQSVGPLDAAPLEVGGEALMARPFGSSQDSGSG